MKATPAADEARKSQESQEETNNSDVGDEPAVDPKHVVTLRPGYTQYRFPLPIGVPVVIRPPEGRTFRTVSQGGGFKIGPDRQYDLDIARDGSRYTVTGKGQGTAEWTITDDAGDDYDVLLLFYVGTSESAESIRRRLAGPETDEEASDDPEPREDAPGRPHARRGGGGVQRGTPRRLQSRRRRAGRSRRRRCEAGSSSSPARRPGGPPTRCRRPCRPAACRRGPVWWGCGGTVERRSSSTSGRGGRCRFRELGPTIEEAIVAIKTQDSARLLPADRPKLTADEVRAAARFEADRLAAEKPHANADEHAAALAALAETGRLPVGGSLLAYRSEGKSVSVGDRRTAERRRRGDRRARQRPPRRLLRADVARRAVRGGAGPPRTTICRSRPA